MTFEELKHWIVYDRIDPIGNWRDDFNSAKVCTAMVGGKVSDFMPDFSKETKPNDPAVMTAQLMEYFTTKANNG
jgi:hypothetical protein